MKYEFVPNTNESYLFKYVYATEIKRTIKGNFVFSKISEMTLEEKCKMI